MKSMKNNPQPSRGLLRIGEKPWTFFSWQKALIPINTHKTWRIHLEQFRMHLKTHLTQFALHSPFLSSLRVQPDWKEKSFICQNALRLCFWWQRGPAPVSAVSVENTYTYKNLLLFTFLLLPDHSLPLNEATYKTPLASRMFFLLWF